MRETVKFSPNVPVEVALAYGQGKEMDGFGRKCMMYSLVGDRVMFLDLDVSKKIEDLGIKPRQPFCIRKEVTGKRGAIPTWRVWIPNALGEQPDGTFAVPRDPERAPVTPAPAAVAPVRMTQPSNNNGHGSSTGAAWASPLLTQTNTLVDAYVAALKDARGRHPGVTAEDVRALLTAAYIAQTQTKRRTS